MYQNPMKIILVPPRYRCLGTTFHYVKKKILCFIMLQANTMFHHVTSMITFTSKAKRDCF